MTWLILWIVLAIAIIVLTLWTFTILIKQKKIWAAFAKKYDLKLIKNGVFHSHEMDGTYQDLRLQIFSDKQLMPDGRGYQYRTVIQFILNPNMPTEGVIASRYFTPFVTNLDMPKKWPLPKGMKLEEEPLARATSAKRLTSFWTIERAKAIEVVANMKRCNFVFIFDEHDSFLRVETTDPLDDMNRMEKIIKKISLLAQSLAVKEEEVEAFNKLAGREERVDYEADDEGEEGVDIGLTLGADLGKTSDVSADKQKTSTDVEADDKDNKKQDSKADVASDKKPEQDADKDEKVDK